MYSYLWCVTTTISFCILSATDHLHRYPRNPRRCSVYIFLEYIDCMTNIFGVYKGTMQSILQAHSFLSRLLIPGSYWNVLVVLGPIKGCAPLDQRATMSGCSIQKRPLWGIPNCDLYGKWNMKKGVPCSALQERRPHVFAAFFIVVFFYTQKLEFREPKASTDTSPPPLPGVAELEVKVPPFSQYMGVPEMEPSPVRYVWHILGICHQCLTWEY